MSPGADWGDAAAAENGLALVEAGVAHHGTEDGQPAVEVAQTAGHQHAILTPRDTQLDERPTKPGGENDFGSATNSGSKGFLKISVYTPRWKRKPAALNSNCDSNDVIREKKQAADGRNWINAHWNSNHAECISALSARENKTSQDFVFNSENIRENSKCH